MNIIGRQKEQIELKHYFNSGKSELIAVTDRRRVGKTYLIKEVFKEEITFYFTGSIDKQVTNEFY
ncbi:MAG: hypothetical protein LBU61_01285 [Coriobacteriales bacterium]|nr:hypothetical protein [Coriobacteriales bacterium]